MRWALLTPWWHREGARRSSLLAVVAGGLLLVAIIGALPAVSLARESIAVPIIISAAALILYDPVASLPVLFGFFIILGSFRRALSYNLGGQFPSLDPLLVVPALSIVLLALVAINRGATRNRTLISSSVLVINLLALTGTLNPLQGGLRVGIAGLFYYFLPMLWFWVGRGLIGDRQLGKLLMVIAGFSAPVAVYGVSQSFGAFPVYDKAWANFVGPAYTSIYVGGVLRPFASFASAQEYATFLSVAIIILAARLISGKSRLSVRYGILLSFLGVALFLTSVRGVLILCLLACATMVAVRRRASVPRVAIYGLGALIGLFLVASRLGGGGSSGGGGKNATQGNAALVAHQVNGLSDPLNSKSSTASGHVTEIYTAIIQTTHNPIGYGTGITRKGGGTTSTSGKAGPKAIASTTKPAVFQKSADADPGNIAISWGIVGLGTYLVLLFAAGMRAYRLALARRDWLSFAVLGILVGALFQWFGQMYVITPMVWLSLGWLDRVSTVRTQPAPAVVGSTAESTYSVSGAAGLV